MYFHKGDFNATTTFHKNECEFEDIYVAELKSGYYLKSEIPYFYSASNGHLSVSSQIKSFGYYDSDNVLLETIQLTYVTECQITENSIKKQGSEPLHPKDNGLWISMFMLLLVWFLSTHWREKNDKNHISR